MMRGGCSDLVVEIKDEIAHHVAHHARAEFTPRRPDSRLSARLCEPGNATSQILSGLFGGEQVIGRHQVLLVLEES